MFRYKTKFQQDNSLAFTYMYTIIIIYLRLICGGAPSVITPKANYRYKHGCM